MRPTTCFTQSFAQECMGKIIFSALIDFMRAHLQDNLDEISSELRVSANFISFACAFDKMFSLCANYPKGMDEVFRMWMKEYHTGELLFRVERSTSGGRMDIVSHGHNGYVLEL